MGSCFGVLTRQSGSASERSRVSSRAEEEKLQEDQQTCQQVVVPTKTSKYDTGPLAIGGGSRLDQVQPGALCLASWTDQRLNEDNSFKDYLLKRLAPEWEPDQEASECHACKASFTISNRKHHCRRCGKIFCKRCVSYRLVLRHLEDYGEKEQKACCECWNFRTNVLPTLLQGQIIHLLHLKPSSSSPSSTTSSSSDLSNNNKQNNTSLTTETKDNNNNNDDDDDELAKRLRKTSIKLKLIAEETSSSSPSHHHHRQRRHTSTMDVYLQWRPTPTPTPTKEQVMMEEATEEEEEDHVTSLALHEIDFIFAGFTGSVIGNLAKVKRVVEEKRVFTLVTIKDEHLHFVMESEEERARWVQALRECVQQYERKEERLDKFEEAAYDLAMVDAVVAGLSPP